MSNKIIEKELNNFFKLYHKIEILGIDNTITCLTQNDIHLINIIGANTITVNELSDILNLTMGTVSIALNKLEKKKFIKRTKTAKDKRKVYISLTNKGKLAKDFQNEYQSSVVSKMMSNISSNDIEKFLEVLSKMKNNLKDIEQSYEPLSLVELNIGDKAIIDKIDGTQSLISAFSHKGLVIGREIKVLDKNKGDITLQIGKIIEDISSKEASKIICIKKDFE